MKSLNVFLLIAFCCINSLDAQDTKQKMKLYSTWVSTYSDQSITTGVLYQLKDSSILVSSSYERLDYYDKRFQTIELHIDDIEIIKTRRTNSIAIGAVIGSVAGFSIGYLSGYYSNEDDPHGMFAIPDEIAGVIVGIITMSVGGLLGAGIGAAKKEFLIYRRQFIYDRDKEILKKYAIRKD